jgi:hypothetical protein
MSHSFWNRLLPSSGTERFESLIRPLGIPTLQTKKATNRDVPALLQFLEHYFGAPPIHPLFRPILDPDHEIILFVEENTQLVAMIRYKYTGLFEQQPIHLIDCFCVHPSKRGSGLATQLLATLHAYTNGLGLRYSLFLKEGRPLPKAEPLYSSHYVFRAQVRGDLKSALSPLRASALVQAYRQLHPDTLWLYDIHNTNQHWLFWKEGFEWILLCVQNAFQIHQKGQIGWITACFASEPMRSAPFEELVKDAPYDWIWMDRIWLPATSNGWTEDGPFHWYPYQWSTNLRVKRFYGLVV